MNFPPTSSDSLLMELVDLTPEQWRTLMFNRIFRNKDIFIDNFKKNVISIINLCMKNVKADATLESIQNDLTRKIIESQFEFEYKIFFDGIVEVTFEYVCKFIIQNSMDNIKRTQNALNSFSSTTNDNIDIIKPEGANEGIKLQESCQSAQIQYLPETNNAITDSDIDIIKLQCTDEVIKLHESSQSSQIHYLPETNNFNSDSGRIMQSYIFKNNSQNRESLTITDGENGENDIFIKKNIISHHNHINLPKETNSSSSVKLKPSNEINIENNYFQTPSLIGIDAGNDYNGMEEIMAIAMKHSNEDNFKYVDAFEDGIVTDFSSTSSSNKIDSTPNIEKNGDHNTDPLKLDEEYKMNGLKILENLVTIEHNKLEVQKNLTKEEFQLFSVEPNEQKLSRTFQENERKNKSQKSKKKLNNSLVKEEWKDEKEQKNHCCKNSIKSRNSESRLSKTKHRKSKGRNNLENLSLSQSHSSVKMQNDKNNSLATNGPLFSSSNKMPESIISTTKNTKNIITTNSVRIPLASQNAKDNSHTNELKTHQGGVENISVNEKGTTTNNSNAVSTKVILFASASNNKNKDLDVLKNESTNSYGSVMKTSDYKKIYEMDRKSLFHPDIIISSPKTIKDPINDTCLKKENSIIKTCTLVSDKKFKTQCNLKTNNNSNAKKIKSPHHDSLIVGVPMTKNKMTDPIKTIPNSASNSSNQKRPYSSTTVNRHKFKRVRAYESDGESKTNTVVIKNKESDTIEMSENKESVNNTDTLKNEELNRKEMSENEKLNTYTSENNSVPEWMKIKFATHNIKPVYIVIDRNKIY